MFKFKKKTGIYFYNTLGKTKEEFRSLQEGKVKIYTCGPTVYDVPHIGNLRAFIFADTLQRVLRFNGYSVEHVINITDVGHLSDDADSGEDKIEKKAKERQKSAQEIAKEITDIFFNNLKELNIVLENYKFPRATEYIDAQIALIETLEEKGYTYKTSDGIYFDTSLFSDYGKLGGIDIEGLKEGARVAKNKEKKNPTDFALWKFSKKEDRRQQEWNSPWGTGFPGWHIECSAMARAILGKQIDIHTGGIDHIAVHHNNEIAQSECASGLTFAQFWMHNAFLTIEGGKAAKSTGNVIYLEDLQKRGFNPLSFRYLLHTVHYRKEFNFTWDALEAAQKAYFKILHFVAENKTDTAKIQVNKNYLKSFTKLVNDDLSIPEVIALLWDLLKNEKIQDAEKLATLMEFDKVLGLNLANPQIKDFKEEAVNIENLDEEIQKMLKERELAREEKDWSLADILRDKIESKGFKLVDEKDGVRLYLRK
jgi:cysteinyl-tRNA synthetase